MRGFLYGCFGLNARGGRSNDPKRSREKGADSVRVGIKHVQSLAISYTASSSNIEFEVENYSWKVTKDGDAQGIEDPKKPNHGMSAVRYGLTILVGPGTSYDPHRQEREGIEVSVTRRKLKQNGAR